MIVHDLLDLTDPDVTMGQHSAWLPRLGVKVPFQWGGRLQKYRKPGEASYPLAHLGADVAFSRWLAARRMGPGIGEWHYFKTVISEHPGAWWADPCGAYGYAMESVSGGALQLTRGAGLFDIEALRAAGVVEGSPGAWNDLNKPGNVVNGYLIDVRRSGWDRLRWLGATEPVPRYVEDRVAVLDDLRREGQFPYRERQLPYQEFYLDGAWIPGERDVRARAETLGFSPKPGETVLDIGCQLGGFLAYTRLLAMTGTEHLSDADLVGVDAEAAYVDLARRLARANGWNICYRQMDVTAKGFLAWFASLLGPRGIDHLLLLSMTKHLPRGEADLWWLVDAIGAQTTYLETNAVKAFPTPEERMFAASAFARGGVYIGDSTDRNLRRLYRVPRSVS